MKLLNNIKLLIAADGGAGSGKTTASKLIAKKYGLKLLTSGLLYRFVAYKLLKTKKIKSRNLFLKKITKKIASKDLKNRNLFDTEVTKYTSKIAKIKRIRNLLKSYQINFAKNILLSSPGPLTSQKLLTASNVISIFIFDFGEYIKPKLFFSGFLYIKSSAK